MSARPNAKASSSRLPPPAQPAAPTAASSSSTKASSSSKETDLHRELPASLRPTRLEFSSRAPFEPTTLETLPALLHDVPPAVYASKLSSKLVPLSNPPRPSTRAADKARAKARREADGVRRKVVGLMSRKEAKRRSIWTPKAGEVSYSQLRGLGEMWEQYMVDLLGLQAPNALRLNGDNLMDGNVEGLLGKMAKAEFVGATLKVKSAPNADLVGVRGIVIHETASTFKIVTPSSAVKIIPKDRTVFALSLPLPVVPASATLPTPAPREGTTRRARMELDLFGSQFLFRSGDRAGRKFKTHAKVEMSGSAGMKL